MKTNFSILLRVVVIAALILLGGAQSTMAESNSNALRASGEATNLLLFGGVTGSPTNQIIAGDMWRYDGTDWTQVSWSGPGPSPRNHAGMVFDQGRSRVVLYGGYDQIQGLSDTWEYVGQSWVQVNTVLNPGPRGDVGMVYDTARGVTVLFGGAPGTGGFYHDTWEYDGTDWHPIATIHSPPGSVDGRMTYDETRGRVVLVTAWQAPEFGWVNETWEYDGVDWQYVTQAPSWRYNFGLAYDSARQRVVLFGGYQHGGGYTCELADTWEYAGQVWTQITTPHTPPGRCGHAMTYDSGSQAIVVFSGDVGAARFVPDMWRYNGADWTQVAPLHVPPARVWAAMVAVPAVQMPPTVDAGGPYSVAEGSSVIVTATGSDPEGGPLTYVWDLDNDGVFETPGQSVTFSAAGLDGPSTHMVTVQVTDSTGLTATDQTTVLVGNVQPTVDAGPDAAIDEGSLFTGSGQFIDPGTDTWSATVDYGDGSGVQPLALNPDRTFNLNHVYDDNGLYSVSVSVSDDDGSVGLDVAMVTVLNVAPAATLSNDGPVTEGEPVTVGFADQFDPSAADTVAGFHYAFACDGGPLDAATYANSSSNSATACIFNDGPSIHTVRARIIDKDDGYSEYTTLVAVNTTLLDFYLHGTGSTGNPPVLFLDNTAPIATTAKYKDSSSLNLNNGNPWKEVGTWTTAPPLSIGNIIAPSSLRTWIGLKNSDDQGTRFDLRVEIYKNDASVASGDTYCITGVTRNPSLAQEVTVTLTSFAGGYFNGTGDVLTIKVFTRIGTDGAGGFCGGHSNAVGLRMYFDAVSRPSQFETVFGP